jgi:tRNA (mo5U34)-methyltransferase
MAQMSDLQEPSTGAGTLAVPLEEARRRIAEHEFWYHTIDVAPGVTTAGWFDLRHALDLVPFPDVRGKRCLDVGTFDGFYAFEMERRGAAEVVAIDVEDQEAWDWPADARQGGPNAHRDPAMSGPPKGAGFRLLAELTGSKVDWRACNVYDVTPERLGEFDVVVVGSLLIHLQNPVKALEAVRSVCRGQLFSADQVEVWLSILGKGRPMAKLRGTGRTCQWWLYNGAGHQQILLSAGFRTIERSPYFLLRYGSQHPKARWGLRTAPTMLAKRALTGDPNQGVLHRALLAEPQL